MSAPLPPQSATLVTAPVRRLDPAELPDCLRLSADRKWPLEDRKWALLFEVGDVYGIDAPDGGLAGAVVATRYGKEVTAISMMLVAERFGRRGLGRRLMMHALEHSAAATASLTATDDGRPLYEQVGFRTIGHCIKYTGVFRPGASDASGGPVTRPATPADLPAVLALDAVAFGAPRTALLTRLQSFAADFRVVEGPSGLAGFGGCWRNVDNMVIGPVIAQDTGTALALIRDLTAGAGGECRLDLEDRRPELISWAEEHGFSRGSTTAVMVHGDPLPGDRSRLFTPVMVALG